MGQPVMNGAVYYHNGIPYTYQNGVAVFAGGWAISQLWLFWIAPIVGAAIGAAVYRFIGAEDA